MYTDNPARDWDAYCEEQERELERRPVCACCGERIQDDYFYDINGENICPECLEDYYRKETENYLE